MDVILHLPAPRCASASFHACVAANTALLARQGIVVWGPDRMRALMAGPRRAGRVALALERAARDGARVLLASDPGICGPSRESLRSAVLCPRAGDRLAERLEAFGAVTRLALTIRGPEAFWTSCLAQAVAAGRDWPDRVMLVRLAAAEGWRGLVEEIAQVAQGTELLVLPHESFAGLPEQRLAQLTGATLPPLTLAREWLNRGPDLGTLAGTRDRMRWRPFDAAAERLMRERYSDDLHWLTAGAEGLARLARTRGNQPGEAGAHPHPEETRGRHDDIEERRMGGHR